MSDLRSPYLSAMPPSLPKWKCGECKAEFPPHPAGGLFEHMRIHLAAVVVEHCTACDGDGRLLVNDSVCACPAGCVNGRRTRPASSPESAVAIEPEEEPRPALEKMAAALREKARREDAAEEGEHLRCVASNWEREAIAARAQLAAEKAAHLATQAQCAALREALGELVDVVDGHLEGDSEAFDSFTLQPSRDALATDAGKARLERLEKAEARHDPETAALHGRLERAEREKVEAERGLAEMTNYAHGLEADADGALRERLATAERER